MKYLIAGAKRTGTTLLCAVLANAGANFGFPRNREWFRGSGDYEHQLMLDNYKHLKRARSVAAISDRLARREHNTIEANLRTLLEQVDYIKYPPLSEYLPVHVKRTGNDLNLIVVIRKFNDFALSSISKGGGVASDLSSIYLDTYRTHLLNLHLYGGCVLFYEQIVDARETAWTARLSEVTGIDAAALLQARADIIKPTTSSNKIGEVIISEECDELYRTFQQIATEIYSSDKRKQHKS
ncbi:hypothetical protein [Neolewinella antarctica]|uniref:Sulfotransferase family protein n=1 Tax=Neolewinella antarctica TaxID=442734 RepID=A0ABX0XC51_9BACT|nr:hypothetical protein [Neolewinella antarctica]NJC26660.1 hypothetical protein [Neolewinella antarctica]